MAETTETVPETSTTDAQQVKVGEKKWTDADQAALRRSYEQQIKDLKSAHVSALAEIQGKLDGRDKVVKDAVINVLAANMSPTEKRLFDKLSIDEQLEEIQSEDFQKSLKSQIKTPVTPQPVETKPSGKMVPIGGK